MDDDAMACGCIDYHMADCPILTDRYDGPPEEQGDDGYGGWI
jgi:hypothetical protein